MKLKILSLIFFFLFVLKLNACECECKGDCSFSVIANNQDFVALVKVISFDNYLDYKISDYEGKMPYSMTVEIIKKYKGSENRKTIKIWGDNGALCRPYISNFKVGEVYLIAPEKISSSKNVNKVENPEDYTFFICWTDYLKVDLKTNKAMGNYSKKSKKVSLYKFQKDLKT